MSINVIPISNRTLPWQITQTAGGGYTKPMHAFIPHASMQVISTGHIPSPGPGHPAAGFALPLQTAARPYPLAQNQGTHGIRLVNFKASHPA